MSFLYTIYVMKLFNAANICTMYVVSDGDAVSRPRTWLSPHCIATVEIGLLALSINTLIRTIDNVHLLCFILSSPTCQILSIILSYST